MWVYLRAIVNRIFIATAGWTASRRWWRGLAFERRWDDRHQGWPERPNCSNESAMVRLSDQRSADRLSTFSRRCLLSVSIDQLDDFKADAPLIPEAYTYLLAVQCLDSLSDGLAGYTFPLYNTLAVQKPPTGSTGPARAPEPTRFYYVTRSRASPGQATNCARDAERRLAHASCRPLLPRYQEPLRLHRR